MTCSHAPIADPRLPNTCAKCGKPIPNSRDLEYEAAFLEQVGKESERRFGIDVTGYKAAVARRLVLGAKRYGDTDFLHKDVIGELQQETEDVSAYAVLEAQKVMRDPSEGGEERLHHLFEASVFAACADWHARRAQRGS